MAPWAYEFLSPEGVDVLLRLISLPPWIVTALWAARRLLAEPVGGTEVPAAGGVVPVDR